MADSARSWSWRSPRGSWWVADWKLAPRRPWSPSFRCSRGPDIDESFPANWISSSARNCIESRPSHPSTEICHEYREAWGKMGHDKKNFTKIRDHTTGQREGGVTGTVNVMRISCWYLWMRYFWNKDQSINFTLVAGLTNGYLIFSRETVFFLGRLK